MAASADLEGPTLVHTRTRRSPHSLTRLGRIALKTVAFLALAFAIASCLCGHEHLTSRRT